MTSFWIIQVELRRIFQPKLDYLLDPIILSII